MDIIHGGFEKGDIAAVVPALNEEVTIGSMVLQLRELTDTVIVVDDGSTDRTSEVARMAGAEVIRLEENHGKAFAVMTGLKAVENRNVLATVIMDGDGQHKPADLPLIVDPILSKDADLVIGSRLMNNSHKIPAYRKVGQKVLNRFTNVGAKEKLTDTQSGYRAMNMKGIKNMDFNSSGYGLESGMIVHFASRGLKIKEVPIDVRYDVPIKHKKNPITMGFGLMNHLVTLVGLRRPLMFISVPGFMFSLVGAMLGVACLNEIYLVGGSWLLEGLLSGFLVTIGIVLMVSGLTLNTVGHIVNQRDMGRAESQPNEDRSQGFEDRKGIAPSSQDTR